MSSLYRLQLLRYSPNRLSEEFYNVAVLLYAEDGRLVDARFSPDFVRLRCNPLADVSFLQHLKDEFENRRLAGEGFSTYIGDLKQNLSQSLHLSEETAFLGGDAFEEVERLTRTYLSTPKRSEIRPSEPAPGTRRWLLGRMREAFRSRGVLDRLESNVAVGAYVSPRFSFQIDYAYKPNGQMHYIQALSLHHDLNDAGRLCFVFDRIRSRAPTALTAVFDDTLPEDTRELLATSEIRPWAVSQLDELAIEVRRNLGR